MPEPPTKQVRTWEVERDRFGVHFSGPLEVGECIEVVPASALERAERALAGLLDAMEAAGFPHEDCDECSDLRAARDRARSALSTPEDSDA